MEYLYLLLLIIALGFGLYLLADFLVFTVKGVRSRGEITGFIKGKYINLPILRFTDENNIDHEYPAKQVDQLLYLLNPAREKDMVDIIYKPEHPRQVRVYGYIRLIAAFFVTVPVLMLVVGALGRILLASKFAYLLVFGLLILGGFFVIKMIQRYY